MHLILGLSGLPSLTLFQLWYLIQTTLECGRLLGTSWSFSVPSSRKSGSTNQPTTQFGLQVAIKPSSHSVLFKILFSSCIKQSFLYKVLKLLKILHSSKVVSEPLKLLIDNSFISCIKNYRKDSVSRLNVDNLAERVKVLFVWRLWSWSHNVGSIPTLVCCVVVS